VLIYDVGVRRGQAMLCAWLITSDGIAAAETVPITASTKVKLGGFAQSARNALGVTRVTLARAPRPRGRAAPSTPSPAAAPSAIAVGVDNLDAISQLLLPESLRRALIASRSERILVLPAADFST